MSTIGTIAPNFHEGTRSEYLAQYVFSAFGTSQLSSHSEDSGIDLYCTLGERIGQRLHVRNYYFVQVKSEKKNIIYGDEKSVEWLLSHKYPLFICCVNKKTNTFEVYQTLSIATCSALVGIKTITLSPESKEKQFDYMEPKENIEIFMGPPIMKFDVTEMANDEWIRNAKIILKSWIELDQSNIDHKPMGYSMYNVPTGYQTNLPLEPALRFIGNFKDAIQNRDQKVHFYDAFFKLLSQIVHQTAADQNCKRFRILSSFVKEILTDDRIPDTWGTRLLSFAINAAHQYLGIPGEIKLSKITGENIEIPTVKIIQKDMLTKTIHAPLPDKKKIPRNEPCPCGSGKKYKKCCGR